MYVTYAAMAAFHRYGAESHRARTGGESRPMRSGRALRERVMKRKAEVEFDEFGWTVLNEAAQREGVTVEELIAHATMYYLADQDGKRLSRRPFSSGASSAHRAMSVDRPTAS